MANKDIRLEILLETQKRTSGTAEFVANEYLGDLQYDVGSIKRALQELIEFKYIKESNVPPEKSIIDAIKSEGNEPAEKLKKANGYNAIRIFLTLEGKRFLIEDKQFMDEAKLSYWKRKTFWPVIIIGILGGITGITSLAINMSKQSSAETQQPLQLDQKSLNQPENLPEDSLTFPF